MRKADLEAKILAMKTAMEPLALGRAKITKKHWEDRFRLDILNHKELEDRRRHIKNIYETTFTALKEVYGQFSEEYWTNLFAQEMRDMPEYKDLRSALTAFKNQFMGKKENAKSPA
jgi:hypothetical protein